MLNKAVDWLNGIVQDIFNAAWRLLTATLFHIPDVTGLPQVQAMTARSLMVVNTAYILAIMAAGIVVMTAGTVQTRYGAQELLPRLVAGITAANLAVWISQTIVGAGNALVLGLTGQGIASGGSLKQLSRVLTTSLANPLIGLLTAMIGLVMAALVLLLIAGWIVRFAALIVLSGIAPLALSCHGLPWTETLANLWWKAMGGMVATVVLQAVALNVSLAIYLDPNSNLAAAGMPVDPTGLLNQLVILCLLWFTVRLPGMVRGFVSQSGGKRGVMGTVVRLVAVQRLTTSLGRTISGARGGRSGTAGIRAPRGGPGSGSGFGGPRGRGPAPGGPGRPGQPGRPGAPGAGPRGRSPMRPPATRTTGQRPAGSGRTAPTGWPGPRSGTPAGASGTGWPGPLPASARTPRSPGPVRPAAAGQRSVPASPIGSGWSRAAPGAKPARRATPPKRRTR